jgi:hypothetical protein
MLRKLLVRDSAEERIQELQPKNNPFTGTELIWNARFFQFNQVTPEYESSGSNCLQFLGGRDILHGIGGCGRGYADCWSVLLIPRTEEELSLLGQQRPLRVKRLVDGSSSRQIVLYLKKANRTRSCFGRI